VKTQEQVKAQNARDSILDWIEKKAPEGSKADLKKYVNDFWSQHSYTDGWSDPLKAQALARHMLNRVGAQVARDLGRQAQKADPGGNTGMLKEWWKMSRREKVDTSGLPFGVKRQAKDAYDSLPPPVQNWLTGKAEGALDPKNPLAPFVPGMPIGPDAAAPLAKKAHKELKDRIPGFEQRAKEKQDLLDGKGETPAAPNR